MNKTTKILLILICLLFLFTRFYKSSEIPPSVYWDEASIGYNAYSISYDAKDEWGKFLPVHFRAFGEFKLPVYIYSTVPFVKLFGLNSLSIRAPAILYSLLSLILVFLIVKKIFRDDKVALFSSFFLSISPWFFIFSRTGYEATAGITFFLAAIYSFISIEKSKIYLITSTFCFILTIYSYNSFRMITPILFVLLLLLYLRSNLSFKNIGWVVGSMLILSISLIPIIRVSLYDAGFVRTQAFRLFPTIQQVYDLQGKPHYQLIYDRSGGVSWWQNLFFIANNYSTHLSPNFLLFKGDPNPRHQQPDFGQIYILDLIFIILGIIYTVLSKKKWSYLIIVSLFLSLSAAVLFKESPHALRALPVAPFIAILSGVGISFFLSGKRKMISVILISIYVILFGNYYISFLRTYSTKTSQDWHYGYKKIYQDFGSTFSNYDHIVISDQYAQPYIFALFYQKYSPLKFRTEAIRSEVDKWGFSTVKSFNKFIFDKLTLDKIPKGKNLVFATPIDRLVTLPNKGVILNLDNSVAFYIYEYEK